ncbi:hypothetical protein BZA05DRAFT_320918, partial [Tricharina praecox]|uniref:uncharacterized protein n=1 Tax=Tricharina praecox TaxID=43433 RepID=UPI00221F1A8B
LVSAHARIKYPPPIGAPAEAPEANAYNAPLAADGSQFPCKGLHKSALLSTSATTKWTAGESAYFEILGHLIPGAEGALAAHSGGSCQASLSFDGGVTWKVLHSYIGGCPRGVPLGSNLSTDPDQRFNFVIPANTRAGPALFAWTWIAVTGNRDEFYMNCAKVEIQGGGGDGGDMLEESPDMFLGDMNVQGHIGQGQCKSTPGAALRYPNPGEEV